MKHLWSALRDIPLGPRIPTSGSIVIDGTSLPKVVHAWRSRTGHVPQRVTLFDRGLEQNVALTWDEEYNREKVMRVVGPAPSSSRVASREHGIDERMGELAGLSEREPRGGSTA
jgi:ABC-type transport system involved in cytochrome bd biosynthesis fused ATPase/permease subunit